jgi:hypothetical protein
LIDAAARQESLPSEQALRRVRRSIVGRAAAMGAAVVTASSTLGAKATLFSASVAVQMLSFVAAGALTGAAVLAVSPAWKGRTAHPTSPVVQSAPAAQSGKAPPFPSVEAQRSRSISPDEELSSRGQESAAAAELREDDPPSTPISKTGEAPPQEELRPTETTIADGNFASTSGARRATVVPTIKQGRQSEPERAVKGTELADTEPKPLRLPTVPPKSIAQELQILREARKELGAGQAGRVLEMLDGAEGIFRGAALEEEFRTAHIAALCQLGRSEQARIEISALVSRWPNSPAAARLSAECAEPRKEWPR